MKGLWRQPGLCPVCGEIINGTWRFHSEDGGLVTAFIHEWATPLPDEEYEEYGQAAYDGDACYRFDDGRTKTNQFPPQAVEESRTVPKLN